MRKNGRVRVWRGGPRCSLSVAAPFVWRCLNSRTITPFPHPPHLTGHAELPNPALGQDSMPLHTKGHPHYTRPSHRTVYPDVHRSSVMHITGNATTRAVTGFPARNPGSSFASVCDTFCISRTLMEFTRVARISDALLVAAPVLNQGSFPPPALPDFLSITGLCATP